MQAVVSRLASIVGNRKTSHQRPPRDINQVQSAITMGAGEAGRASGVAQSIGDRQDPSGSLNKLADQLQALLGRVSERRLPSASDADGE